MYQAQWLVLVTQETDIISQVPQASGDLQQEQQLYLLTFATLSWITEILA